MDNTNTWLCYVKPCQRHSHYETDIKTDRGTYLQPLQYINVGIKSQTIIKVEKLAYNIVNDVDLLNSKKS